MNLLLGAFEELNGMLSKDDLELFHYYNEVMNGFQGLFLEVLKNYQYAGVPVRAGREPGMEREPSERLQTLDQIIKAELPREEHTMKKVNAFRKQKGEDADGLRGGDESPLDRSANKSARVSDLTKPARISDLSKPTRISDLNKSAGDSKKAVERVAEKVADKPKKSEPAAPTPKVSAKAEAAPDDSILRTSVSKAINATQGLSRASTLRQPEAEPSVPNFRIDPKNEKAVEINGDEENGVIIGNRFYSSTSGDGSYDPLANATTKLLTPKVLSDYIDDFLIKKRQHDEQAAESHTARTTPEEFLLIHLKKKYGLPELIMQNALAIVESAKHYNGQDYKASLFSHVSSPAPPQRNRRGFRPDSGKKRGEYGRLDQNRCGGTVDSGQTTPGRLLQPAAGKVASEPGPGGGVAGPGVWQDLPNHSRPPPHCPSGICRVAQWPKVS